MKISTRTLFYSLFPLLLLVILLLVAAFSLSQISTPPTLKNDLAQIPVFSRPEFSSADLKNHVSIVNFFASWCTPCESEHSQLVRLKNEHGALIYGINYKDSDNGRVDYLQRLGNPYTAITPDGDGELGGLWGVYGVPETIIVDSAGHIRYRLSAPLTPELVNEALLPLLRTLQQENVNPTDRP